MEDSVFVNDVNQESQQEVEEGFSSQGYA
jgi:hypothetical protein